MIQLLSAFFPFGEPKSLRKGMARQMKKRFAMLLTLAIIVLGSIGLWNLRLILRKTVGSLNRMSTNSSDFSVSSDTFYNQEESTFDSDQRTDVADLSDENAWDAPPNQYDYGNDSFWGMRGEYPIPILKEVELSKEEEDAVKIFFESHPALPESIWQKCKVPAIVYLMDVTGDNVLEVLIQYYTTGASDLFGGRLEVFDLKSGRLLGNIWKNGSAIEGMGWYLNEEDGTTAFYVMDMFFYDTLDETYISGNLRHAAYIFSRIEYAPSLTNVPLWLYNVTIHFTPYVEGGEELSHHSLLNFTADDLVKFIDKPNRYYDTLRERWMEGCDSSIRDSILYIQPVETTYKKYAYINADGLHLYTDNRNE